MGSESEKQTASGYEKERNAEEVREAEAKRVRHRRAVVSAEARKLDPKAKKAKARAREVESDADETPEASGSASSKDLPEDLVALAISGGGIRSATFGLGVMQALARHDLMTRIDYLSTVSGGGYIGSSLTWLLNEPA